MEDFVLRVDDAWAQKEVADRRARSRRSGVLEPAYTGHGYATEAVRALLRLALEDLGLCRVVANAFAENTSSCRLMGRVGMRREAHAVWGVPPPFRRMARHRRVRRVGRRV